MFNNGIFGCEYLVPAAKKFIEAVKKIVRRRNLPQPRMHGSFPHSLELLAWVLRKQETLPEDLRNLSLREMFYDTDSKEAEIICLADDLERVLKVIGLTFLDIPEWGDWYQACERRKADLEEQLA